MTTERSCMALCRLLAAWVHRTAPEPAETPDFEALFQTAKRHLLTAALCAALEQTGLMADCPPETAESLRQAKLTALRRTMLVDAERRAVLDFLEQSGIWYAPLKGDVFDRLYPQYGARQSADCDILFDGGRWRDVRGWMKGRGYQVVNVRTGAHDTYQKPPVYNFEMHRRLFVDEGNGTFSAACAAYYADVKARLVRDGPGRFGYHMGDEDHYIYFLAHTYKHYSITGTGLRSLLDAYLYRRSRQSMDEAYIAGELEKLGLTRFEDMLRSLTEKLFGPAPCPALTEQERQMLDWVASSGVYGTYEHSVRKRLSRLQGDDGPVTGRTKARYLFQRFFPPWSWYQVNAPFVYRHRWLTPFFWVFRLFRGVVIKGRRSLQEVGMVFSRRE